MRTDCFQGVYVHTPFCQKKCYYCDFPSYEGIFAECGNDYVNALCAEISNSASAVFLPATVYFGGGTPTLLSLEQFAAIVDVLRARNFWSGNEQERTCEANPGTVDKAKLRGLRELGFNRLSLGVQSLSDSLLATVGRIHTARDACQTIAWAREAGWENVSVDLMYGLPGQSLADLQSSVQQAVELGVEHISVYGLTVEEGTVLGEQLSLGLLELPDEGIEDSMYDWVSGYLVAKGYERYEISNYARPGFLSQHNLQYWSYLPYKGFGVAACSFIDGVRSSMTGDVREYIKNCLQGCFAPAEVERIDRATAMAEFMFMGLRTASGILPADFYCLFNEEVKKVFGVQLQEAASKGLLELGEGIKLTRQGMKYGNKVFLTFLP